MGLPIDVIQTRALATPSITVIRSNDNDSYWPEIEQRLETAAVGYQILDWQDIQGVSDLGESQILFLPNLEDISRRQASAIETWIAGGGRVIVSGRFAEDASRSVREGLRNAIGMQWIDELPGSAAMRLLSTSCDRDPACRTAWMPEEALGRIPEGGILSLSGGDSQAAAAWQMPGNATAVGVSPQVTFFGWEWGRSDRAVEADVAWLQAALRRLQDGAEFEPVAWNDPAPTSPRSEPRDPFPNRFEDPSSLDGDATQPIAADTRPRNPIPATRTNPEPSTALPSRLDPPPPSRDPVTTPLRPTARSPIGPSDNTLMGGSVSGTGQSDTMAGEDLMALRVAPAGLNVERGDGRISQIEALKMQRELSELIGRVQSATQAAQAIQIRNLVAASREDSADEAADLELTDRPATLSPRNREYHEYRVALASDQAIHLGTTATVLDQARATLAEFPDLVAAGNYRDARDRWIDARLALLNSYPDDRQRAQPEIRAIWLDRGTIVEAGSPAGLERLFDRLDAMGITIVFFETINAGYPIYPSAITRQNPLTQGWDPLEAAVELAHARNMELHAWVWAFAVGNERHNEIVGDPIDYPGPVLAAHPEWANRDDQGRVRDYGRKTFLDPANPEARWFVIRELDEIVTNYDVDGIQLDYIRYPFQDPGAERTYGYGIAGREQFEALTGVDPLTISPRDRDLWEQWTQFRVDNVTTFVREVREWIDNRRPGLTLSTAVFAYSTHERIHKLQQHWEAWIEEGIVDQVVLMSYAADSNRLQSLVSPHLINPSPIPIIPSVRLHDLDRANVTDQLQALRDLPTMGYALFATAALSSEVEQMLRQTQGEASELLPERAPFEMARQRYELLQNEWDLALRSGNLWIEDEELLQWRGRTLMLSEALALVAQSPNAANLVIAKTTLQDYRVDFEAWLRFQGLRDSYQVQTWRNRLLSLEILLNYGDRLGFAPS
ncbi:MAG: glycoside hydrolase family 10 protein [Oscillatoriales cyanobacterium]|nr:MAG: glycoside hydrolase family 10 protein [Oscillatoriales cyanobacterium]